MEPLSSFFAVSVILLGIGIYGLTTKRNAIRILFSVELIYNAANLNVIAFARLRNPPIVTGQVIVLFTIALAAMEAAVGLSIISLLTALVSLFSVPYMRQRIGDDPGRYGLYYSLYALYSLGMIGTVLATNLIEFYLFFEIMLVPSFFLIAEWGYGERDKISLTYFIWTHVGALVLLVGILVTGFLTGSTDMESVVNNFAANPSIVPSLVRIR